MPTLTVGQNTTKIIEMVCASVLHSPQRSARKQSIALEMSNSSALSILHLDLNFHLYITVMTKKLNEKDFYLRFSISQKLLQLLWMKRIFLNICFSQMKPIFNCQVKSINRIVVIGLPKIHDKFMNKHFIHKLLFGAYWCIFIRMIGKWLNLLTQHVMWPCLEIFWCQNYVS